MRAVQKLLGRASIQTTQRYLHSIASAAPAKDALRDATADAIRAGVFGVPTIIVDGELFWGCDSLPHVDAWLAGEDPVPVDLDARWQDLPTGAIRPGNRR